VPKPGVRSAAGPAAPPQAQVPPVSGWPRDRRELLALGLVRLREFCTLNGLPIPPVHVVDKIKWRVSACAYYRPETGIVICPEDCAVPAPAAPCRAWSWPGSTTDRTPFGVIAHELGHHADCRAGPPWERDGAYSSGYSEYVRGRSGEDPLTGYCDGDEEWFAEMFRLFVTNAPLLAAVRPATYTVLRERWKFVFSSVFGWRRGLGCNVPDRIIRALINKGAPQ
jgi:hypothetical protein